MQLLFGHDASVTQWAAQKIDGLTQPTFAFGVIDKEGALRGCFILQEITPNTAEFIVYAEAPCTPNVFFTFFDVAFNRIGYGRLQTTAQKSNAKAKKENPRWGFKFEGTAKDFFGQGQDALRYGMLKANCKWLRKAKGKANGTV